MAEKLLKTKKRVIKGGARTPARASLRDSPSARGIPCASATEDKSFIVVGNYKTRQLDWIKKNGVYNWPVREEDGHAGRMTLPADAQGRGERPARPIQPDDLAKVNELWLYANAKSERHVFSAEFVGKMTAAEFRAAYPTYAKLGASKHKAYYVFKAKPVDYPPELGSQVVLARTADFGRGCAKVKKAVEQFKRDGEFAPLAAYLPKELGQVPSQQLRVCEAAVQLPAWSPVVGMSPVQEKIASIVMSVASFGRARGMSASDAYCYLDKYSGMSFLDEHYSMSRCYSEEMMDESLSKVCRSHGGTLK